MVSRGLWYTFLSSWFCCLYKWRKSKPSCYVLQTLRRNTPEYLSPEAKRRCRFSAWIRIWLTAWHAITKRSTPTVPIPPSLLSINLVCNEELSGHQPFSQGTDGARRTTLTTEIVTRQYPDVGTVYESFLLGVKISGERHSVSELTHFCWSICFPSFAIVLRLFIIPKFR